MITSTYDPEHLHRAFGIQLGDIDMGRVESLGVGANFGRVRPGQRSDPHQHDETETFVIVAGQGELVVDGGRTPARPGMVIQFDPFETHWLDNTGDTDLLFATFYWRDTPRAAGQAPRTDRRRFAERPVFVFSTPPTPNGDLHIGHLSGPYLGTDAYVRFQRMNGARVWHLAATDDHQSYVAACAATEGRTEPEVAAHYAAEIAQTLALMDIEPDQVVHTSTSAGYREALRAFFDRVVASGRVRPQEGPALFDGETGQYLYEPYVSGGCPGCGAPAGGNICEECGEPNVCTDLTDPRPGTSDAPPRTAPITRYTLPLHELRDEVTAHHHVGRAPARLRELAHRVLGRPLDVALTHPGQWGVPPSQDDVPGQVLWVWNELAFGFLWGIETLGRTLGEDWRADAPLDDWKIVHFLGYDNTFYHSILSPALYKLATPAWTPDVDYHVNEFYLLDGEKFSTSRRHAVWGKELLSPDTVDGVRFYLARTRPETSRTNFTLAEYERAVRETLAGTWQGWLSDLARRVERGYGGVVPDAGIWTPEHTAFWARLENRRAELTAALGQDGFSLNRAALLLESIVTDTVAFAARESATAGLPEWADETRTVVALELAAARLLACGAAPVMPRFAARLAGALGLDPPTEWPAAVALVPPGTRLSLAGQEFFRLSGTAPAGPVTPLAETAPAAAATSLAGPGSPLAEPEPAGGKTLDWLCSVVREALRLGPAEPVADATLAALGAESLQAIALQYQILERTGADVPIENLLGPATVAELAGSLGAELSGTAAVTPA